MAGLQLSPGSGVASRRAVARDERSPALPGPSRQTGASRSPVRRTGLALLALGVALSLAACGTRLERPPIELGYRDSLIGAGKVLRIENTSNVPLTGLVIEITAPDGEERSFVQTELGGYDTLEVGWKKLGGWQVPAGAAVEIHCDGYLLAFEGRLPPPDEGGGEDG